MMKTNCNLLSENEAARRLDIPKKRLKQLTQAGRIPVEHATVGRDERIALYHADDVSELALELCDIPPYMRAELATRPTIRRRELFGSIGGVISEWQIGEKRISLRID
jgi:hypothetical protein